MQRQNDLKTNLQIETFCRIVLSVEARTGQIILNEGNCIYYSWEFPNCFLPQENIDAESTQKAKKKRDVSDTTTTKAQCFLSVFALMS
jgi:hypothetical protein